MTEHGVRDQAVLAVCLILGGVAEIAWLALLAIGLVRLLRLTE